ncbi:MAG: hypothetical protein KC912_26180 [Proteobacteria bacterium]|nr:hypothetical protein [Pseudomonadota bacterium]
MSDEEFAPPAHDDPLAEGEDDIGEIRVPVILPIAASVALVSALFTLAAGAQGVLVLHYPEWSLMKHVPYVFIASGLLALPVAGQVFTGRLWGAVFAVIVIGFNALCGAAWTIHDLFSGIVVPLPALAAMLAMFAVLLVGLAIPAAARLTAQRRRLYSP